MDTYDCITIDILLVSLPHGITVLRFCWNPESCTITEIKSSAGGSTFVVSVIME